MIEILAAIAETAAEAAASAGEIGEAASAAGEVSTALDTEALSASDNLMGDDVFDKVEGARGTNECKGEKSEKNEIGETGNESGDEANKLSDRLMGDDNLERNSKVESHTADLESTDLSDKHLDNNEADSLKTSNDINKAADSIEKTQEYKSVQEATGMSDAIKSSHEISSDEIRVRTPESNGEWRGERGNSTWYPDRDYVPPEKSRNPEDRPYSNPDNLSWGEILDKYGLDGIEFKDGFPVFDEISRGTVEIEDFETGGSDAKDRNFKRADIAMAEQRGCTPQEVKEWRDNNNYTWHECEDKRTMQKVPNEVHANVPHDGGRSQ